MPFFAPVGGGGIPKAAVSASSGATIDTTSRPGKTIYKFTGSGSITFSSAGTCEVLVIGGGGAGSYNGGGGAGGHAYRSDYIIKSGTIPVTVGAGGAANAIGNVSRFDEIVALQGGNGGNSGSTLCASSGGSNSSSSKEIHPGFSQGNIGGNCPGNERGGGGGGGAGAVGGNGRQVYFAGTLLWYGGGHGGAGIYYSITGTSTPYCGGGGGGTQTSNSADRSLGGAGGGGRGDVAHQFGGSYNVAPENGVANTGGGGGSGINTTQGTGGSGIVIVVIG